MSRMPHIRRRVVLRLTAAGCLLAAGSTQAGEPGGPPPLAARFEVVTRAATATAARAQTHRSTWTLHRSAQQIALLKGAIDEVWTRDANGAVRFERAFHDYAKVTDYSPGELATLDVAVDWAGLGTLVDGDELAALRETARSGRGTKLLVRLEGRWHDAQVRIDWLPAWQLPALLQRTRHDGSSVRIALLAHAARAPLAWPQAGTRSADYLHLDAADFGDMDHEPVVRLSEALDIRSGWRLPHAHD